MKQASQRAERGRGPSGIGWAFLALAVQVLLPFLVAYEIGILGNPAYAETTIICSASGSHAIPTPANGADQPTHSGPCSLCIALAAAHAFTGATPVTLPLPRQHELVRLRATATVRATVVATAGYHSRAPPSIG